MDKKKISVPLLLSALHAGSLVVERVAFLLLQLFYKFYTFLAVVVAMCVQWLLCQVDLI